jgi:hypothetical protein
MAKSYRSGFYFGDSSKLQPGGVLVCAHGTLEVGSPCITIGVPGLAGRTEMLFLLPPCVPNMRVADEDSTLCSPDARPCIRSPQTWSRVRDEYSP